MPLVELARRLWFFLRRDRISAELAEEMRLHMELRAESERAQGLDPDEAAWSARRSFGNSTRLVEASRDQWGLRWLDELSVDVKHGLRSLHRAPLPSAIILLTLSLGIGATLAAFVVMDAALFRPLPVREPEQLVIIPRGDVPLEGSRPRESPLSLDAMRARSDMYEAVGAYAAGGLNLTGGASPQRVQAGLVTPSALELLGVQPTIGRLFLEEEEELGSPDVVLLSHRLWRTQFGGDESVIGRRLSLNDREFEVVGVMPPRFAFPEGSELWIPMTVPLALERTEIFRFIILTDYVARLAPGMMPAQADAHLVAQMRELGRFRGSPDDPIPEIHSPLRGFFLGDASTRLRMVMGLATLLLVAACANAGGLLLSRWSSRQREIAVRAAIGASKWRLRRQVATESALFAVVGAVGGLAVTFVALRLFSTLVPPDLAALTPPVVDARALLALLALAIVSAVAIGTLPALAASRGDLTRTLKVGAGPATTRPGGWRVASVLVVIEVGLAVVLLVGSGLLLKSIIRMHAVDTGIRAANVVTARLALSRTSYPEHADRSRFYTQLQHELTDTPGLDRVGLVSTLPLRGELHLPVALDLPDRQELEHSPFAEWVYATPEYFDVMGIRTIEGRALMADDTLSGGGVLISESIAREFWPGSSPIGERVAGTRTIAGVVNDIRGTALDGEQNPQFYMPFTGPLEATIVARSPLPAGEAIARIHDAVRRVDPSQMIYDAKTMEQVASDAVAARRATSSLATIFGATTLLLAALGLYGLLAYAVVQRMPELGIRFALGARRAQVVRSVVGDGAWLTLAGAALGLIAAFLLARFLEPMLFDVSPTDTTTFVVTPVILLVTAIAAALVPASRAARVDPARVLKAE